MRNVNMMDRGYVKNVARTEGLHNFADLVENRDKYEDLQKNYTDRVMGVMTELDNLEFETDLQTIRDLARGLEWEYNESVNYIHDPEVQAAYEESKKLPTPDLSFDWMEKAVQDQLGDPNGDYESLADSQRIGRFEAENED
jgi:hypothetical protein